ncbi:MAG TPA: DAK2 domain-containing protein [Actinomycetales bacterium]|nr:DAK2 domain-containing protein [Actinomycetales bacterium]
MLDHLDAGAARRWVRDALEQLSARREEIDALNVYPVPDSDTGTNLCLTVQSGADAVDEVGDEEGLEGVTDAFARGALLGARGSSGVILSQLVRGWADVFRERPDGGPAAVRAALLRAADQAYAAVARPVEGTMLTVARAAAEGARGRTLREVVSGAAESARVALGRTTDQLEALHRAGVVDAGGRGLVVVLESLSATVHGRREPSKSAGRGVRQAVSELVTGPARRDAAAPPLATERCGVPPLSGPAYEVMYLLSAADDAVPLLRATLDGLGEALVVVGGGGVWNVHVHADDVAAVLRAGRSAGDVERVRVTSFARQRYDRERSLQHADSVPDGSVAAPGTTVVVVGAPVECLALLADHGVLTLPAPGAGAPSADGVAETVMALVGVHAPVVLVPATAPLHQVSETAASVLEAEGRAVAVLPTQAFVQALAAASVHDRDLDHLADVQRMTEAAASVRWSEVGLDEPLADAVPSVVDRLLGDGGELLTVLACGLRRADGALSLLLEHVRRYPHVEVTVLPAVESDVRLLQLGVE